MHLEPKDIVVAIGVAVTLLLGLWNLWVNHSTSRRTSFVNTVTSQRIVWIEQLRQDIGAFSGLAYHWSCTNIRGDEEKRNIIIELDRLRYVIRLRLNPEGEQDKRIQTLVESILRTSEEQDAVTKILEELTVASQALLKEEWEKVKTESKYGPLSNRA
jgi:hypothetical protein